MTDRLDRIIGTSDNVFGIACNTTALVNEACRRHDLGPTAAAALGRALTGAILLAGLLKDKQKIQLIFEGNGPLGKVIAEACSDGSCRGYTSAPHADVPLKNGAIDVAGGIGQAGFLRVIKDIGFKEKYTGLVQLYTSEVGEDIAYYLSESEQTPSIVSLGVHLQPDGTVTAAGGFLLQTLPPADEDILRQLETAATRHASVTSLLSSGNSPKDILALLFANIPHKPTGTTPIQFTCSCSQEKMEDILHTLGADDISYLLEQEDGAEIRCDYCGNAYHFSRRYLMSIMPDSAAGHNG